MNPNVKEFVPPWLAQQSDAAPVNPEPAAAQAPADEKVAPKPGK